MKYITSIWKRSGVFDKFALLGILVFIIVNGFDMIGLFAVVFFLIYVFMIKQDI